MNKTKYIIPLLMGLLLTACSDFIDIEPVSTQTEDNFFNEPENAIYAVNACYQLIAFSEGSGPDGQWLAHNYEFFFGDILSDDSEKGSSPNDLQNLQDMVHWDAKPENPIMEAVWIKAYDGIARCNTALYQLSKSPLEEELRNRLMGEVYFIRAYWYFYLSRVFGGVPLIVEPAKVEDFGKLRRASLHDTYLHIEKDLKQAIEKLPLRHTSEDLGRATKGAARHYLARLYMYIIGTDNQNSAIGWQQVYDQTSAIILSGQYSLMPNYALIFEPMGENSSESVFELQMMEGSTDDSRRKTGENINQFTGNRMDWGWGFNNPTVDLFESFENEDPRLSATVYGPTYNEGIMGGQKWEYNLAEQFTPYLTRKTALLPGERPSIRVSSSYNWRLARYAETLLNHAEASFHLGKGDEALEMINIIRDRARSSSFARGFNEGSSNAPPTGFSGNLPPVNASGSAILEAIYQERRVELAMESLRYFDLVRTGLYVDALQKKRETFRTSDGETLRYKNIDLVANCKARAIEGPNGNIVPLLPIPLREVQDWGLEQNKGYN
jgi:starch-binding outer membrane protein, SusD/RagB family